jgi:hypothetical protein
LFTDIKENDNNNDNNNNQDNNNQNNQDNNNQNNQDNNNQNNNENINVKNSTNKNDSNIVQNSIKANPPSHNNNNNNSLIDKKNDNQNNTKNTNNNNDNNNKVINQHDINLNYINSSFSEILTENFFELHPILTIIRASIISPIIFNIWVFAYNFFLYFGWNALYYTETKIQFRIIRDDRKKFVYPVDCELDKIFLSILTTMFCCLIIRLIVIVSKDRRDELNIEMKNGTIEDRNESRINFENEMLIRRIIALILMFGVVLFFFYYCVVFCYVYQNTQSSLMYSGIWSIMFVYFAIAPIFIVAISFVEFKYSKVGAYI